MKLAIHHRPGSFSDRWIAYCKQENIPYKLVNVFDNDIIEQLKDSNALMWHHHHNNFKDVLMAKKILFALEHAGINVFPDFNTAWHFDDKVAQKYLLEAIDAPLVPGYVFYDKQKAKAWAGKTDYPKVFKLKGGAGSSNVKLVRNKPQALKLINKAFGQGFSQYNALGKLKERIRKKKAGHGNSIDVLKGVGRLFVPSEYIKKQGKEKGYAYFQQFIPHNESDIRVIVVGNKAFALKRLVREGDFRASGSGKIIYEKEQIDIECVKVAFEVNKLIKSQSIAFDFVFDKKNKPLIVEISYGFSVLAYDNCPGYWDDELIWHEKHFNPQYWMIQNVIKELRQK